MCVQHGFDNFLSRLEIAEYEPDPVRSRLNTRDTRNKVSSITTSLLETKPNSRMSCLFPVARHTLSHLAVPPNCKT